MNWLTSSASSCCWLQPVLWTADQWCILLLVTCPVSCWQVVCLTVGYNLSCELADQYCISLLVTCPVNCWPVVRLTVGNNLSCELADQYCILLLVTCPVNCWPVVHLAVGYNLYSELLVRGALLFKTHRNNLCNCMFVCFVDCWQIFLNICMWIEGLCHCCPNDRLFLPFTELIYFTTKTLCQLTWVDECQLVINSVCVVGKSS